MVPFYDVEKYFVDCLDSIIDQDFANLEVLLVDDGSRDGSRVIAERYADRDERFRVVPRVNGGLGAARNTGVQHARGRYLTFVDSDDKLAPGALRKLRESLIRSGSDIAVGAVERFDSGKNWFPPWVFEVHDVPRIGIRLEDHKPLLRNLYTWNKLFRREFYVRQGLRFREGVAYEDQPIITQLLDRAASIDVIPDIVYLYRERDDRSSISQQTATLRDLRDRLAAWRISAEAIRREMTQELYEAWLHTLVNAHLWWYLSSAGTVDDVYWSELRAAVVEYCSDVPDWVWRATAPSRRAAVRLALLDRREDLQEFVRRGGADSWDWPATVGADGVHLALPFSDDPTLSGETFLLHPEQVGLVHAIENLHWRSDPGDGLACWISGWAYLAHIDLSIYDARVSVVLRDDQTGEEHSFVATETVDLATPPPTQYRWADVRQGAFGAWLPLDGLTDLAAPGAAWSILLRVEAAGFIRTEPVTRLLRLGAAGMIPPTLLSGGRTLVADWQLRRPLVFRVRRTGALLDEIKVDGRVLSGAIRTDSADDVVAVSVSQGGRRAEASVTTKDGGKTFRLEVPRGDKPAPGHRVRWAVDAWTRSGEHMPLTLPSSWLSDSGQQLVAATTQSGWLEVEEWQLGTVADVVRICDDGSLRVRGRVFGMSTGSVHLESRSVRSESRAPGTTFEDGRFEVVHDLSHEVYRFGRLPLGQGDHDFHLVVADQHGAAIRVPLRVSPVLNDDLPMHVQTREQEGRVVRGPDAILRLTLQRPLGGAEDPYQQNQMRTGPPTPGRTRGVLMRAYFGEKATDNGIAIQAELRRRGSDLPVYWAVQDHSIPVPDGGVPVIVNSKEWYDLLGSVDYYVDNMYQPEYHRKPDHQVMVQTFHGYPFKQMGHPHWIQQQFSRAKIAAYDARAADWDYLVSPARYATPHLVRDFAYGGEVLEIGYPRNDILNRPEGEEIRAVVRASLGIGPEQTAVLYAPTFRDYLAEGDNKAVLVEFFDYAQAMRRLGDDHVLLVRGHAFNARSHQRIGQIPGCIDVTDYPEVSDLYLAADACITDYSSLRFDFAVTGKPLLFHVPDLQRYRESRGWIMDYEPTAPGPLLDTTDEIVDRILDLDWVRADYATTYETFRKEFLDLEDGRAAERFVDAIFVPRGDA